MPGALLTDLYELNMAASYLRRHMDGVATFSLFVRSLPPTRSFLVCAGIESALDWLGTFGFDEEDLEYLSRIGFDRAAVEAFSELRFTGEVRAVPEGRILFAEEPLLEVSAPIAQAQLVETYLLNQVTFQTAVASKAARCRIAADGRVELVEFGFRRTHGTEAAVQVARLAAMVGFSATSNVEAARRYGLTPSGTMAHSYVEAFPTELEAFRAFAEDVPRASTFLVDTYDTLEGVGHAIEVIGQLGLGSRAAVRIDSGDLDSLARSARELLDRAGMAGVRIFLSGGLDEIDIQRLVEAGVPFDAAGIGTRLGVSADTPYLDTVYKLVDYDRRPVMKLSEGKATLPGAKQVFRGMGLDDVLGLREEPVPPGTEPLLRQVMVDGLRTSQPGDLGAAGQRFESDLSDLPSALRDLDGKRAPKIRITDALHDLNTRTIADSRRSRGAERT